MANLIIASAFLGIFIALLLAVRARDGVARIRSIWAAQGLSLVLVCLLMVAGGFLFKTVIE